MCLCRLTYLHEGIEQGILHGSLKSSNILLDHQWNPKVSDFGIAKLFSPRWAFILMEALGSVSLLRVYFTNKKYV